MKKDKATENKTEELGQEPNDTEMVYPKFSAAGKKAVIDETYIPLALRHKIRKTSKDSGQER